MAENALIFSSPDGFQAMERWYSAVRARIRVPCESVTVPTRFGDTHMLAAGPPAAPAVILLHGMEGTALSWRHQLEGLATDHRLFALDIIGSAGKSAPSRLPHTGHDYAEWLMDVLRGLGLSEASFVGMSNGGWLIFKLAAQAPEAIANAVLLSANGLVPVRFPYTLARLLEARGAQEIKKLISRRLLSRTLIRTACTLATPAGVVVDPDEVEWFYLLVRYYRYRFPPPPVSDDLLHTLQAPTFLLMGEKEPFFAPQAAIARARRHLPNLVHAEVVSGIGHSMATDAPQLINQRIRTFLAHGTGANVQSPVRVVNNSPGLASA